MSERPDFEDAPHTIGHVIRTVIQLSKPDESAPISALRAHDGMVNRLACRALEEAAQHPISPEIHAMIVEAINSRRGHIGQHVDAALRFLQEDVRVQTPPPAIHQRVVATIVGIARRAKLVVSFDRKNQSEQANEPREAESGFEAS